MLQSTCCWLGLLRHQPNLACCNVAFQSQFTLHHWFASSCQTAVQWRIAVATWHPATTRQPARDCWGFLCAAKLTEVILWVCVCVCVFCVGMCGECSVCMCVCVCCVCAHDVFLGNDPNFLKFPRFSLLFESEYFLEVCR